MVDNPTQRYSRTMSYARSYSSVEVKSETMKRVIVIKRSVTSKFASNEISTAKYNAFNFVPVFLFNEFRRWANIFFLLIALLQQIPYVSPGDRYSMILPLLFILTVSAIKEIIEDIKRHRIDHKINYRKVQVFRNNNWIIIPWIGVQVGDVVKVMKNNTFPADIVLLSSSEDYGICFIETSNLDGETNLKIRNSIKDRSTLSDTRDLEDLQGTVHCELPSTQLYEFNGFLKMPEEAPVPLGPMQLLLRGSILKNASWVIGVVIYTGHETKLMMSYTRVPQKHSSIDRLTNILMLILLIAVILMSITSAIISYKWSKYLTNHWYIQLEESLADIFYNFLTYMILFSNLIPISLQVTLEVVRFLQAIFINLDVNIYDEESNTRAAAKRSNLNEELGQVKYVFADKTGTLTRNVMKLKMCAIGDKMYTMEDLMSLQNITNNAIVRDFLLLLTVCHTVTPLQMPDGDIEYNAISTDEKALVEAAKDIGYIFKKRDHDLIEIEAMGETLVFTILDVLEYTSARKMMSVIIRDSYGIIKLYTKGADSVIYERIDLNSKNTDSDILSQHIHTLSSEGLRTLACACIEIEEDFYNDWKLAYNEANMSIMRREEKLALVSKMIEKNLNVIGVTGIEDKLQDGVPETIAFLWQANINVWVLTGDAQKTAINIGYACKLIHRDTFFIHLNQKTCIKTERQVKECYYFMRSGRNIGNDTAIIIDGRTLEFALSDGLISYFFELCKSSKVVVCCRVSPTQKAQVVDFVRKYTKSVTLAIGDGSNDVAMIQRAHIGVGISGKEGMQAASAADYSIAQFRFLKNLMFVHGAWNCSRISKLILYSIYKNICFNFVHVWYEIYTGWSGQSLFDSWTIGFYNVIFTALPPFIMGLFDKPYTIDKMLSYPILYKKSQEGKLFNWELIFTWIVVSLLQSAFLYWLPLLALKHEVLWADGIQSDQLILANCIYTCVIVTVCFKAGLMTTSWTWLTHCSIWTSIFVWIIFLLLYSLLWPIVPFGDTMHGIFVMLWSSTLFWLCLISVPIITLLPDFIVKIVRRTVCRTVEDVLRERKEIEYEESDSKNLLYRFLKTRKKIFKLRRIILKKSCIPYMFSLEFV